MATIYKLVGYDRGSECLGERHGIPQHLVADAKRAAGVAPSDGELMDDRALTDQQAQEIARLINAPIDLLRREFFLEPYVAARPREGAHAS
jgi:hypothetical protein